MVVPTSFQQIPEAFMDIAEIEAGFLHFRNAAEGETTDEA